MLNGVLFFIVTLYRCVFDEAMRKVRALVGLCHHYTQNFAVEFARSLAVAWAVCMTLVGFNFGVSMTKLWSREWGDDAVVMWTGVL
jgi:hypothetical protein